MNYVQHDGPNQYGPRKGTFGLALHMTEGNGGDGDLAYLLRDPARGVSANFFAHADGTIHQLMPMGQASGSMNPRDRSKVSQGYYGQQYIIAVLGTRYTDPNAYSISIEIGGRRAQGPNPKQVKAVISWGLDMRRRFPTLVGAFGHADQTDTKGCPGITPAMRSIFDGIGGHGRFHPIAPVPVKHYIVDIQPTDGQKLRDFALFKVVSHKDRPLRIVDSEIRETKGRRMPCSAPMRAVAGPGWDHKPPPQGLVRLERAIPPGWSYVDARYAREV